MLFFATQFLYKTINGGASWTTISPDLSRKDAGVPAIARHLRERRGEGRAPRRHLRDRTVAARRQRDLDRLGRRRRARDARRRRELARRHAEGGRRLEQGDADRRVAFRREHRVRLRVALPRRRPDAARLPHARRRRDVDDDHARAGRCRFRQRRPRGSEGARAAVRGRRARRVRRRSTTATLGVADAEPATHVRARRDREGGRSRDRDARPRVLDPRRHDAPAFSRAQGEGAIQGFQDVHGGLDSGLVSLSAGRRLSPAPQPEHRHAAAAGSAGREESAGRRDHRLLPRRGRARAGDARDLLGHDAGAPLLQRRSAGAVRREGVQRADVLGAAAARAAGDERRPPVRVGPAVSAAGRHRRATSRFPASMATRRSSRSACWRCRAPTP